MRVFCSQIPLKRNDWIFHTGPRFRIKGEGVQEGEREKGEGGVKEGREEGRGERGEGVGMRFEGVGGEGRREGEGAGFEQGLMGEVVNPLLPTQGQKGEG